jgi:hypothetical protein
MSSIYNPNGTLPAATAGASTQFSIASSTNASPIHVTFSAPTTIQDQDTIEIEGHATNTAANGQWVATKVSTTVYSLNGSTGNGVGGATGYAIDYSLTPALTIPSDGDLINAASANTQLEGVSNVGPFLYRLAGKYRIYNASFNAHSDDLATTIWSGPTTLTTSYADLASATSLLASAPFFATTDALIVRFRGTCQMHQASGISPLVAVAMSVSVNGGANFIIPGSSVAFSGDTITSTASPYHQIELSGLYAGSTGTYQIGLQGVNLNGSVPATFSLVGSWTAEVLQLRPN